MGTRKTLGHFHASRGSIPDMAGGGGRQCGARRLQPDRLSFFIWAGRLDIISYTLAGAVMTQEQLTQIFEDICLHGRHVEGWACENREDGHSLTDIKRGGMWARKSPGDEWRAAE